MIKVTTPKHKIKIVKPGDGNWYIDSNFIRYPRAGFEINQQCPREYILILQECINNGWILPVAYMKDTEHMWEQLQK